MQSVIANQRFSTSTLPVTQKTAAIAGLGTTIASDLKIGDIIKLSLNSKMQQFRIVHKGNPDPTFYDVSCDGIWLQSIETIGSPMAFSTSSNSYASSSLHTYLNGLYTQFGTLEQAAIKEVKIPYGLGNGSTVRNNANGLAVKVFTLSSAELGTNAYYAVKDGKPLTYFATDKNDLRVRHDNNKIAQPYWTRTNYNSSTSNVYYVSNSGSAGSYASYSNKYYPVATVIIDYTTLITRDTTDGCYQLVAAASSDDVTNDDVLHSVTQMTQQIMEDLTNVYTKQEVDTKLDYLTNFWGSEYKIADEKWWRELSAHIKIATEEQLAACVGKCKTIELTSPIENCTVHQVRCVAYNCDRDINNPTGNTLTFQTRNCVVPYLTFSSNDWSEDIDIQDESTQWMNSQLRDYCISYRNALPFQGLIATTSQGTATGFNEGVQDQTPTYNNETVFIPSGWQVGFTIPATDIADYTQWNNQYPNSGYNIKNYSVCPEEFDKNNTSKTPWQYYTGLRSRIKFSNDQAEQDEYNSNPNYTYSDCDGFWLRSRYYYGRNEVCRVNTDGYSSHDDYSYTNGFAPAFVIS